MDNRRPPGSSWLEVFLACLAPAIAITLWSTLVVIQKAREAARRAACVSGKQF